MGTAFYSCKRHGGRKEVSPSPTDGKWVPQETRKQARMIFMATRPTITAAAEAEWRAKSRTEWREAKIHFATLYISAQLHK